MDMTSVRQLRYFLAKGGAAMEQLLSFLLATVSIANTIVTYKIVKHLTKK